MRPAPTSPLSATVTSNAAHRMNRPTLPTTTHSATSQTSTHGGIPVRRFRNPAHPTPLLGSLAILTGHTSKSRRMCSRPLLLFIALLSLVLFCLSQIASNRSLAQADAPDLHLKRYAHAASHFREALGAQARAEFEEEERVADAVEAAMRAENAVRLDDAQFIFTAGVSDPLFGKCTMVTDRSVLHASLRRGPDQEEIKGREFAKQPRDFDDTFAAIDRRRFYFHPDRPAVLTVDVLGAGLDKDLDDAIRVATTVVEKDAEGKLFDVDVPVAYMRTTRQDGLVTIVNIGGSVNKTSMGVTSVQRYRRVVSVGRGYGKPCEVSFVRPREMVKIHVLLAYSERPHRLEAFLKMFDHYFRSMKTDLVRIVVSTTEEELEKVKEVRRTFPDLTDERFTVLTTKGDEFGNFSRAVALREAAKLVPKDEVIFLADADLVLGGNFLQNCRVNIVNGNQVWFPVMFSLYPYGKSLSSRDGLWRRSSYGMACMYSRDFDAIGGFGGKEETEFTGWGSEDVFLYNRFRDSEKYAVLRTLEPGLQHKWHGKDCEHNEHYENCMRTVYMTIGSQDTIAKLMSDAKVDISSLTKNALPV